MAWPNNLSMDSFQIGCYQAGRWLKFADQHIHAKIVPYTVIVQVLKGYYEVERDGEQAVIRVGDIFLSAANKPLRFVHLAGGSKDGCMGSQWMHVSYNLFGTMDLTSLLDMPIKIEAAQAREMGRVISAAYKNENDCPTVSFNQVARRMEWAYKMLDLICQVSPLKKDNLAFIHHSERMAQVVTYIRENLACPLNAQELARQAHMSCSQFYCVFQTCTGLAPMQYVKRLRISEACRFLSTTDLPIGKIAERVGFCNQFLFSRVFKEQFNVTPTEYRRNPNTIY